MPATIQPNQDTVAIDDISGVNRPRERSLAATMIPWLMCAIGALFYIYEYLLRVAPSVMTTDLMKSFSIDAAALGNLAAFYYYIYTPMQLVVGVSMDRYGPRRLFTLAGIACTMGMYLFASTNSLLVAEAGRFLVGFGSAFAFVGVLKLATIWLPPDRFAVVSGLNTALGTVGGILGNLFLTSLVSHQGWRGTSYTAAGFGLILTIVMLLVLRDRGKYQYRPQSAAALEHTASFADVFKGLGFIISNPQIWIIGIISCLMYLSTSAFSELWGNPYLRQVYHFSPEGAAKVISTIFLGWTVGGPMVGWFSDRIRQRRLPMTIGSAVAAVLIAIVIYAPNVPIWAVYVTFFVFGFFSSAQVIAFAVGREISPDKSAGTAIAVTNMLTMIGGVLFQPLIGKILDWHWLHSGVGQVANGVRVYTTGDYQVALSVLPIALLLSVLLTLFLRETNCRVRNI